MHQGQGAERNTRTTPSRNITPKILTNRREGCPAKESLKPIEQDASRTKKNNRCITQRGRGTSRTTQRITRTP